MNIISCKESGKRLYLGSRYVNSFVIIFKKLSQQRLRPVYTGDFCRATRCNFCRAKVARPVYTGDFCRATRRNFCRAEVASSFEHVRNLMQLWRDKNCIELRDKNRLCKQPFIQQARCRSLTFKEIKIVCN